MDKKFKIVGLGPGSQEYVLPIAKQTIQEADLLLGSKRSLEAYEEENKEKITISYPFDSLVKHLEQNKQKDCVVVVAGDPGFYSLLDYITAHIEKDQFEVIPGISSFQYLFSKIKKSYKAYPLKSLHGRDFDFLEEITRQEGIFLLTDKVHTPSYIASKLVRRGKAQAKMIIGENLSYKEERILEGRAIDFVGSSFSSLCVVVIENEVE